MGIIPSIQSKLEDSKRRLFGFIGRRNESDNFPTPIPEYLIIGDEIIKAPNNKDYYYRSEPEELLIPDEITALASGPIVSGSASARALIGKYSRNR